MAQSELDLFKWSALIAVLGGAAWFDLRERRIPNAIVVLGGSVALICAALAGTFASAVVGAALGLCLLLPLYGLRAAGAGDLKLLSVAGAFVGFPAIVMTTLLTLCAGGVLALAFMLRFRTLTSAAASSRGAGTAARLPYALAISAGVLLDLTWRAWSAAALP